MQKYSILGKINKEPITQLLPQVSRWAAKAKSGHHPGENYNYYDWLRLILQISNDKYMALVSALP